VSDKKEMVPVLNVIAPNPPNVYQCIAAVSAEIAKTGISKDRKNTEQKYSFRGIDDVYNAMAPILAQFGLVVIPRILTRLQTERQTKSGGALFSVIVEAEFDFVSAADSSKVTARTFGEAMDTGDKATNKAMSAAYKYAAFQTFCIPTEGDNDADKTTHEVATKKPEGYDNWVLDLEIIAENGIEALRSTFRDSKPEYRLYRTMHDNTRHEALKTKAEMVVKQPAVAS
jgi:hypothetical protein